MRQSAVFLSLFFLCSINVFGGSKSSNIQYNLDELSPSEVSQAEVVISQIDAVLPETLKNNLGGVIKVKFTDSANIKIKNLKSARTTGFFSNSKKTIYINKKFLQKEKNELARHTLVNQFFHAYDHAPFVDDSLNVLGKECPIFENMSQGDINKLSGKCKNIFSIYSRETKVSSDKFFQNLTFWKSKGLRGPTPDSSEYENVQEYAAVNFEYFIFDKDYKCRRPLHYDYLSKEFNHKPFENYNCEATDIFSVLQTDKSDEIRKFVSVDPKRVYQVQYLLASKGKGVIASFGHSMIRLVVCAPEHIDPITNQTMPATTFGPECLKDIQYHIVLSFRANVTDTVINRWRGITGYYSSVLYAMSLERIINEYNRDQLRDLYGFPINFSKKEKENFVKQALYLHWGYLGSYKFITNNCATETLDMIISVKNDFETLFSGALTPMRALKSLQKTGLIDSKYKKKTQYSELHRLNQMKSDFSYLSKMLFRVDPEMRKDKSMGRASAGEKNNLNLSKSQKKKLLMSYLEQEPTKRANKYLKRMFMDYEILSTDKFDEDVELKKELLLKQVISFFRLEERAKELDKRRYQKKLKGIVKKAVRKSSDKGELMKKFVAYNATIHHKFHTSYGIPLKNEFEEVLSRYEKHLEEGSIYSEVDASFEEIAKIEIKKNQNIKLIEENLKSADELRSLLELKKKI